MGNTCLTKTKSLSTSNIIEQIIPLATLSIQEPSAKPLLDAVDEQINPPLPPSFPTQEVSIEPLPDGITLIWLDANASDPSFEGTKTTLTCLRRLNVASIRSFSDVDRCLTSIKSMSTNETVSSVKIFLIVSGRLSIEILPQLKSYPVVTSVFIFCMEDTKYQYLMKEYNPLVIDICTQIQGLYDSINKQIEELNQVTSVFQFFSQNQNTARNLTKDAASFLWFQLFLTIISDLKCTGNEKTVMLKNCYTQSKKDVKLQKKLADIDLFDESYTSKQAIYWYTKETFIYHLLNKALRTEDIDGLYIFRFFIADLSRQLKEEHKKFCQQHSQSPILILYRGINLSSHELDKLKELVDNLISLNGFISTTKKRWVAMQFAKKQQSRQEHAEKLLFIIEIDLRCKRIVCADVKAFSAQAEEDEVLFNMGTVFKVNRVIYDDNEMIWNVYMTATDEGIKIADDYMELIRREMADNSVSVIFGQLFLQMGNYHKAQEYFLDLSQHLKHEDPDVSSIRYYLGLTYGYQGEFRKAEDCLLSVSHGHESIRLNNLDHARIRNALGWIYHQNGELNEAMRSYQEALIFAADQVDLQHLINAQTYSLIGDIYLEKHLFDKARKSYEQAAEIEHRRLPVDHPRIGVTLNDLGDVFRKDKKMDLALQYYEQAESIFLKKLPNHHPYIAHCWSCMAFVHLYNGNINEAHEYHEKSLKIYQQILPNDHSNIKISEKNSKCTDFRKINDSYVKICARI